MSYFQFKNVGKVKKENKDLKKISKKKKLFQLKNNFDDNIKNLESYIDLQDIDLNIQTDLDFIVISDKEDENLHEVKLFDQQTKVSYLQFVKVLWKYFQSVYKFGLLSAGIFLFIMIFMNFQAYKEIAMHWLNVPQSKENIYQLNKLVTNRTRPVEKDYLNVEDINKIPFLPHAGEYKPILNMNITPPDNRLIIPKIGRNVPIINDVPIYHLRNENWTELENDIQRALRDGVVHYPGTAMPGDIGNTVITGHSSYYFWDPGRYKTVFALLNELNIDDDIYLYYNQKRYHYQVIYKEVIASTNTSILRQGNDKLLTLITCYPLGTDASRLIVQAKLVEDNLSSF